MGPGRDQGGQVEGPMVGTWINQFAQVVDTFGRFAHLLDMNCDALYGSFSSVLRLFESMAELRRELLFILQTITLFRVLQMIAGRLASVGRFISGRPATGASLDVESFDRFQGVPETPSTIGRPTRGRLWPILLFLASAIGGPILINRLWKALKASAVPTPMGAEWPHKEELPIVRAMYDFQGEGEGDLAFHKGAIITVLDQTQQGWWRGEIEGRVGLFPANFVQAVDSPLPPPPTQQPLRMGESWRMDGAAPIKFNLHTNRASHSSFPPSSVGPPSTDDWVASAGSFPT